MPARSRTVLIVEDNQDHALLVRMAAGRVDPGLDVRIVTDGMEALDYLGGVGSYADRSSHPFPQLVILDLIMPGLDGFGVLSWIRERGQYDDLPVVILTSSISPRDEAKALSLRASAFHTKPADVDALGDEVRSIVTRWLH